MDIRIITTLLWIIGNTLSSSLGLNVQGHLWKSAYPGQLLNTLDSMTIENLKNPTNQELKNSYPYTTLTSKPFPLKKVKPLKTVQKNSYIIDKTEPSAKNRITRSEDSSASSTSDEADDYEREYDQFVRKYFDDAANYYLSSENENSNENDAVSNLSSDFSYETDPKETTDAIPYASSPQKSLNGSKNKCRRQRKNDEICVICKNLRNGGRSETCSYERASDPEKYAFETKTKYSKSRDRDSSTAYDNNDDNDDDEAKDNSQYVSSEDSKIKRNAAKNEKDSLNAPSRPQSSCIKRNTNGKTCYYCKDARGADFLKCFNLNTQTIKDTPNNNKNLHQKKKIYKRTISYIYGKGFDSNETLFSPKTFDSNKTIAIE